MAGLDNRRIVRTFVVFTPVTRLKKLRIDTALVGHPRPGQSPSTRRFRQSRWRELYAAGSPTVRHWHLAPAKRT